jgi:hypothetical protein
MVDMPRECQRWTADKVFKRLLVRLTATGMLPAWLQQVGSGWRRGLCRNFIYLKFSLLSSLAVHPSFSHPIAYYTHLTEALYWRSSPAKPFWCVPPVQEGAGEGEPMSMFAQPRHITISLAPSTTLDRHRQWPLLPPMKNIWSLLQISPFTL